MAIHPSAVISPEARIDPGAHIGPWCQVDAGVVIEDGVKLESRVHVYPGTILHKDVRVFDGAILGADPQDLKFGGEESWLKVGARTVIREYCTLNRGTKAAGTTKIGEDVLLMAYVHVGHDSAIGDHAVLANGVQLGGHVQIGEYATIGGNSGVQQFARIGAHAFVGGTLKIVRDVPPACRAFGDPLSFAGLNTVGLQRRGFSSERIENLARDYRVLFKSPSLSTGIEQLLNSPQTDSFLRNFFASEGKLPLIPRNI